MGIEWVEAPPEKTIGKRPKQAKHSFIARQLRKNPGKWALIMKDANVATPNSIKKGVLVAFRPEGAFEAVSRVNGRKGRVAVYARYVGEPDTE